MTATANQVHLDMRVSATGVHALGTTTWTLTVPFYGTHAVVLATGDQVELSGTLGGLVFTAAGDYSGDAVLGTPCPATVEVARPVARDAQGKPILRPMVVLGHGTLALRAPSGVVVRVEPPSPAAAREQTFAAVFTLTGLIRKLCRLKCRPEVSTILVKSNDWEPFTLHGLDLDSDQQDGAR